jgi:hypothetical protein
MSHPYPRPERAKRQPVVSRPTTPGTGLTVNERKVMAVAKIIELTSRSGQSFEDAVEQGLNKATDSVKNVQSAWVKDQQVLVENGSINEYQVTLKVTFLVE